MSIEAIFKNPKMYYLLVPIAQYIFYLIHKGILSEHKTRLILETPIDDERQLLLPLTTIIITGVLS